MTIEDALKIEMLNNLGHISKTHLNAVNNQMQK